MYHKGDICIRFNHQGITVRRFVSMTLILVISMLQGCSGSPTKADSALSSLRLFGSDAQPRFTLDLACAGLESTSDVQCSTVSNTFSSWSVDRHIKLRIVNQDDSAFQTGAINARLQSIPSTVPYLITVRIEPQVEPSFREAGNGVPMPGGGGHPGSVGYRAWIQVFSTSTGVLIQKQALHHRQTVPDHSNVTPAFKTEVDRVIRSIDSAYPG
jgi:hypothetical protein